MIWQEWRAHNYIFVLRSLAEKKKHTHSCLFYSPFSLPTAEIVQLPHLIRCLFRPRHVLGFTITWGYLRWVSVTNHLAATMLDFAMFAVTRQSFKDL